MQRGPRRLKEAPAPAPVNATETRAWDSPAHREALQLCSKVTLFPHLLPGSLPGPYGGTFSLKDRRTGRRPKGHFYSGKEVKFFKARESISIRVLILLLHVSMAFYLSPRPISSSLRMLPSTNKFPKLLPGPVNLCFPGSGLGDLLIQHPPRPKGDNVTCQCSTLLWCCSRGEVPPQGKKQPCQWRDWPMFQASNNTFYSFCGALNLTPGS